MNYHLSTPSLQVQTLGNVIYPKYIPEEGKKIRDVPLCLMPLILKIVLSTCLERSLMRLS